VDKINESIVLVGGGGGVYQIARFLRWIRTNISTIQTAFDHGGHSGQLRDEWDILPPGDIRQAIIALIEDKNDAFFWRRIFSYRFENENSILNNASFGNLFITAAIKTEGGVIEAINKICKITGVKGKVLPVSLSKSELCAELSDGLIIKGEGSIDKRPTSDNRTIVSEFLDPEVHIYNGAYDAIVNADKIVFCPGDFYTSLIPNTLVCGFREAIAKSKAKLIYVVNLVTKKAETHEYLASQFSKTLLGYIGREYFDAIICNSGQMSPDLKKAYEKEQSYPVKVDGKNLKKLGLSIITQNLADETGGIIRHSEKIASIIASL